MAKIEIKDASGKKVGTADLADAVFGIEPNTFAVHQVVRSQMAARRAGTHDTQDPRRGPRRRHEAVAPEGHRPRPRGLDPLAAVDGRRRRLRPAPAQLRVQGAEQGRQARDALGPLGQARRRARCYVVDGFDFDKPSTKTAAEVLEALGIDGPRDRRRRRTTTSTRCCRSATSPRCASSPRPRPTPTTSSTTPPCWSRSRRSSWLEGVLC